MIVCFDFDGVIATYDGWKGVDVLGEPIPETISVMKRLASEGVEIIIFTTRIDTPVLRSWLSTYDVPYNTINRPVAPLPHTSNKPLYHCVVDDRAVNFNIKNNRLSEDVLYERIMQRTGEAK